MRCLVVGVMSVLMVLSTNCSSNSILSDNMEWKLSSVFQSIELTPVPQFHTMVVEYSSKNCCLDGYNNRLFYYIIRL